MPIQQVANIGIFDVAVPVSLGTVIQALVKKNQGGQIRFRLENTNDSGTMVFEIKTTLDAVKLATNTGNTFDPANLSVTIVKSDGTAPTWAFGAIVPGLHLDDAGETVLAAITVQPKSFSEVGLQVRCGVDNAVRIQASGSNGGRAVIHAHGDEIIERVISATYPPLNS